MDEREEHHTLFEEEPTCGSGAICGDTGSACAGGGGSILGVLFGALIGLGIGACCSGEAGFSVGGGSFGGGGASGGT